MENIDIVNSERAEDYVKVEIFLKTESIVRTYFLPKVNYLSNLPNFFKLAQITESDIDRIYITTTVAQSELDYLWVKSYYEAWEQRNKNN